VLGGLWESVGVAFSHYKLELRTKIRNLNLKSQLSSFYSF